MKLDAEALLVDPSIKDQGATYLPLARGENLDDLYVMTYMVAGDVEGFWWDSGDVKRWQSLLTHPMGENIRINASITPGGIGRRMYVSAFWLQ